MDEEAGGGARSASGAGESSLQRSVGKWEGTELKSRPALYQRLRPGLHADSAADAAYNGTQPAGWDNGDNGGFGFGAWTLGGGSNAGDFMGSSRFRVPLCAICASSASSVESSDIVLSPEC